MIENGFVYAVNISAEKTRKKEKVKSSKMDKLYKILNDKNLTLDVAIETDFNKSELKLIKDLKLYHYLEMNKNIKR